MKELDHPNIIKLYDLKEDEDKLYMILEFMDGGTLDSRIIDERNLSEEDVYCIVRCIVDAMEFCHSRNIVHRDLKVNFSPNKPENILYDSRPYDTATLKISDFGFAKCFGNKADVMSTICGSPHYVGNVVINSPRDTSWSAL